jgi:hypothetical protein
MVRLLPLGLWTVWGLEALGGFAVLVHALRLFG